MSRISASAPPSGPPELSGCPSSYHPVDVPAPNSTPGSAAPSAAPSRAASVDGNESDTSNTNKPGALGADRTVSRQPSGTTSASHASSSASQLPSMRWVQTLNKLTMAKASQAKSLAEARREHRKSHDATPKDACPTCSDYSTRGAALLAELEEMDRTLRDMEDSVVEDVRAFRAARRREKREKEREKKREMERKEVRKSAAGAV